MLVISSCFPKEIWWRIVLSIVNYSFLISFCIFTHNSKTSLIRACLLRNSNNYSKMIYSSKIKSVKSAHLESKLSNKSMQKHCKPNYSKIDSILIPLNPTKIMIMLMPLKKNILMIDNLHRSRSNQCTYWKDCI